nr:DUF2326 domain-containing protein [Streptomyces sp. S465]
MFRPDPRGAGTPPRPWSRLPHPRQPPLRRRRRPASRRCLKLAAEVTEEENLQYIVTINTDSLSMAAQRGFDPEPYIRSPRLTDEHETGGLFGFRFKTTGKR